MKEKGNIDHSIEHCNPGYIHKSEEILKFIYEKHFRLRTCKDRRYQIMKKYKDPIFKAFAVVGVFAGILGVLMSVSAADAGSKPFKGHSAKGGMRNCMYELNNSTRDLQTCNMNLVQALTDLETCRTDLDQSGAELGTCNADLSLCESNQVSCPETGALAKTGQTTSYAVGDDGDLQAGTALTGPRFIDSGDGTITDNLTGLIWMKDAGSIGVNYWGNAVQSCNTLANGYYGLSDGSQAGDWRLPNVRELYSLIDFERYNPALPDSHLFINVMYNYWSSTTYAGNPNNAFYLNPNNGFMSYANKSGANVYVLCVRDGS
ncbi:MAG: DUF1566 domain-containing protein [Nitrospiraceae bacterium]|nr:MAG: DUF1566 domain-containing protein [Nitrospiraceae bacterium]